MSMLTGKRWLVPLISGLFFAVVAVVAHGMYVSAYGIDVPFWDQWVAEGVLVLKPWHEGHLTVEAMVQGWNEHRILLTRLVTLGVYEATGGRWSPLTTQYVNVVIYSGVPALLAAAVAGAQAPRAHKLLLLGCVLLLAALPYGWENTVAAFQNQFYFMLLEMLVGLWIAASSALRIRHAVVMALLAVLGIFTMAPAIVCGAAMAGVIACRAWVRQVSWRRAIAVALPLLAICAVGLWTTPHIAAHDELKAQSLGDLGRAAVLVASWPATSPKAGVVLLWLPAAVGAWQVFRRRWTTSVDLLMLGIILWTAVEVLGIAHSRGHGMSMLTPRYTDVLAPAIVARLWFALRLVQQWRYVDHGGWRATSVTAAFLYVLVVAQGFIGRHADDMAYLVRRRDDALMWQAHLQAYRQHRVPAELQQSAIPLPSPPILQSILDDTTLGPMLAQPAPHETR